jgi:hypothetical protein
VNGSVRQADHEPGIGDIMMKLSIFWRMCTVRLYVSRNVRPAISVSDLLSHLTANPETSILDHIQEHQPGLYKCYNN